MDYFENYVDNLEDFYSISGKLKALQIITEKTDKKDMGKIVISTKYTNITGVELAKILRKKHEIETELSSFSYLLAMTSIMDSKEGFERLKRALIEIDASLRKGEISVPIADNITPVKKMELWEAKTKPVTSCKLKDAIGLVCSSMICLYPPGAPVIVPGEEITEETVSIIQEAQKAKIHVTGLNNGLICVVN